MMRLFSAFSCVTLLASVALAGCVENPATGGSRFTLVTEKQELQVGEETAADALKTYGQYKPESRISTYVDSLCQNLWQTTVGAAKPLKCLVLDSETYNAWATPGYLNIYRGLLPYINNEAELAAVLGHESGHINAHHVGQKISQEMVGQLLVTGLSIAVAARTNNDAAATGLYTLGALSAKAAVQTYSREFELEADRLGLKTMAHTGYPASAAVSMMKGMALNEAYDAAFTALRHNGKPAPKESFLGRLYASHPSTPERIDKAAQLAAQLTLQNPPKGDAEGRERYLQALDGTAFGPKPEFGVLGRGFIAFPKARFKLAIPDGFAFAYQENGAKAGLWQGAHAPSYVTADVFTAPLQSGLNPGTLLETHMSGSVTAQTLMLKDGSQAATALATPRFGGLTSRGFAFVSPHVNQAVIAIYTYPSPKEQQDEDAALVSIFQTSRPLTEEVATHLEPVKIRTFRASAGDTVRSRAARLPVGALHIELFRALNGLPEPTENLTSGWLYKTLSAPTL